MSYSKRPSVKHRYYPLGDKTDFSSQTASDLDCYICNLKWSSIYDLYSHVLTQCHKNKSYFTCICCKFKVNLSSPDSHDCFRNKSLYIKHLTQNLIKHGPPSVCLFCRGRKFTSKVVLFVHLICYHSTKSLYIKKCGICTFRVKAKKPDKKLELFNLPSYNEEFDEHIMQKHIYGYELSFLSKLNSDSQKRLPYSCVSCDVILQSNDDFHAHVISRHACKSEYDRDTFVCLRCDMPLWSEPKFMSHVSSVHTPELRQLAQQLTRSGLLSNYVDLDTVCIHCWSQFSSQRRLHAHLVMQHCYYSASIACGLCQMDFKLNTDLLTTYNCFQRHQNAHFLQFETQDKLCLSLFQEHISEGLPILPSRKNKLKNKSSKMNNST